MICINCGATIHDHCPACNPPNTYTYRQHDGPPCADCRTAHTARITRSRWRSRTRCACRNIHNKTLVHSYDQCRTVEEWGAFAFTTSNPHNNG